MLKYLKLQEKNPLEEEEIEGVVGAHTLVVKKEVTQGEEETGKEVDLLEVLHQEESQQVVEEVVEVVQTLLKEDLMLLQKELKETKLFSFQ